MLLSCLTAVIDAPCSDWPRSHPVRASVASLRNMSSERKYHASTFNPAGRIAEADAKKVSLSKVDSWKRGDEFPKEFVTLPGQSYPSSALVDACSTLLLTPKSAELK